LTEQLGTSGDRSGITFELVVLPPKSRGWVRLADSDPTSMPLINPNFIGEEEDLKGAVESVRALRERCVQHAPVRDFERPVAKPRVLDKSVQCRRVAAPCTASSRTSRETGSPSSGMVLSVGRRGMCSGPSITPKPAAAMCCRCKS
jgi:choline dehydrogenase-like flavoprotein